MLLMCDAQNDTQTLSIKGGRSGGVVNRLYETV